MSYWFLIVLIGIVGYLVQNTKFIKIPGWLQVIFWVIMLSLVSKISDTLTGILFIGLIVWWLIRRKNCKRKRDQLAEASTNADQGFPYDVPEDPIKRYASTPNRQAALAELKSSPKELVKYIHQEIDTFFMNEWAKMSAIYSDQKGQFDEDVRDNAGHQMREILDAIFAKFAKQQRAALAEKQSINEELKGKHKEEIDIAMQVYEKWQDKS